MKMKRCSGMVDARKKALAAAERAERRGLHAAVLLNDEGRYADAYLLYVGKSRVLPNHAEVRFQGR